MRFHLGCGTHIIEGWVNIDQRPGEGVVVADVRHLVAHFAVETIYAGHVLEHLDRHTELSPTLAHWYDLLVPGGQLFVSVPNFAWAVASYALGKPAADLLDPLMGGDGSGDAWTYHKTLFDPLSLAGLLEGAGFEEVGLWNPGDYDWCPQDFSRSEFSLNMRGVKSSA